MHKRLLFIYTCDIEILIPRKDSTEKNIFHIIFFKEKKGPITPLPLTKPPTLCDQNTSLNKNTFVIFFKEKQVLLSPPSLKQESLKL